MNFLKQWVFLLTIQFLTGFAAPSKLPPGTLVILNSGPWDNAYSAAEATKTRSWVHIQSDAMAMLKPQERLKLWLQWAPSTEGPWKTRSKGEVELRLKRNYMKPREHVTLKTRGYIQKDIDNLTEATLEMGPLSQSLLENEDVVYFRVAQALRKSGEQWNRVPRSTLKPEENHAHYSSPFKVELGIIRAYRSDRSNKNEQPPRFDTVDIYPTELGPWTRLSFGNPNENCCVSFFVGLGGLNCGAIIPAVCFDVMSPVGELEFWACHDRPKAFRNEISKQNSFDTLWWSVCPVKVPLPSIGEVVEVPIKTFLDGRSFTKTYRIHGHEPTPLHLAAQKVNQAHYDLLLVQLDPATPIPNATLHDLGLKMIDAKQTFIDIRELHREQNSGEHADALANAYIEMMSIQNEKTLLNKGHDTDQEITADARLRTLFTASVLARNLQKWHEMSAHLDSYYNAVQEYQRSGVLDIQKAKKYLTESFPLKSSEPFSENTQYIPFTELLKEWAWTMSNPDVYQQALDIKGNTSPQEYFELAELVIERSGNKDMALSLWHKANDLLLQPESPFYNPKTDDKRTRMERPGWWGDPS